MMNETRLNVVSFLEDKINHNDKIIIDGKAPRRIRKILLEENRLYRLAILGMCGGCDWTPCAVSLPTKDGWYLTTEKIGRATGTGFAKFENGKFLHFDEDVETIAWQRLPAPIEL